MEIQQVLLDTCHTARGVVVAIDVVRAFTTAAFAFKAGAERILLVGTVNEALSLKVRLPGTLVMGESGGMPVDAFDFWNSPAQFLGVDLSGKTLIQRTSAGTQGVVRATGADRLFAASLVVAGATARAIQNGKPGSVTLINTGVQPDVYFTGVEDIACADYLTALLCGKTPDPAKYITWVSRFKEVHLTGAPEGLARQFERDLELCTQVDRFDFAMQVERNDGLLEMRAV